MTDRPDRRMVVALELIEGTVLYSDDEGFDHQRVHAHLSLSLLLAEGGQVRTRWRALGTTGSVAELIAAYYTENPGMKDAVDGLFLRELKRRAGHL